MKNKSINILTESNIDPLVNISMQEKSPLSVTGYWSTLLAIMPPQFFTEEVSKLGSFTIVITKDGSKYLMINRNCTVNSAITSTDEADLSISDELSADRNNSIGAQLRFKLTLNSRSFLSSPNENAINDFVINFFKEVQNISKHVGASLYIISGQGNLGNYKSNGEGWIKD